MGAPAFPAYLLSSLAISRLCSKASRHSEQIDRVFVGRSWSEWYCLLKAYPCRPFSLSSMLCWADVMALERVALTLPPNQCLEFVGGLLMVGDHLLRKGLGRILAALDGKLAGGNFKHIAGGCLLDEILSFRRDADQGIDTGLFGRGLCKGRDAKREGGRGDNEAWTG